MWVTRGLLVIGLLCATPAAWSASKAELEARVQQLERKLDSRGLVEMFEQVSTLQKEVQQLRGELEVQSHDMEGLKKRQRDLYADIDRRLHRLETAGVQGGVSTPTTVTAIAPAGAAKPGAAVDAVKAPAASGVAGVDSTPLPTLDPVAERRDYDDALAILNELRYDEAAAAFRGFLKNHPGSSYADNAQYWLGEVFYVTRDFKAALDEFGKLLKAFPDSPKVPGAMLKMGYSYYELKDWQDAGDILGQVVKRFPGTSTAKLAQERRVRMQREGRIPK